jgi:hypothetical protein
MKMNLWFLAALVMALVGAVMTDVALQEWFIYVSLILGILIAAFNVTKTEGVKFMLAYLVLAAVSGVFVVVPVLGTFVTAFFTHMLTIFGVAALIVAFRALIRTGGSR